MRRAFRVIWQIACALVAAAIFVSILGFGIGSWTLAAVGGVIGLPIGWLFGRHVSPLDMLDDL
jgi:NhaP-type Na+/H+ or K+/H+ antiporter